MFFNSGSISPCRYSPKVPRKKRLKKTMYHIVQNGGKLRSESVLSLLVGGSNFSQAYYELKKYTYRFFCCSQTVYCTSSEANMCFL